MDEYPLQRRIYFLTFIESLEMIFSKYTETCEVITDYPKIGGDDILDLWMCNQSNGISITWINGVTEYPLLGVTV